jgi:hypothetical protein
MDPPDTVAHLIANAIEDGRSEVYIGWPERFFARVNAVAPQLVDRSLAGKSGQKRRIARNTA